MSFDRLAPHYRWMEWVLAGGKLQRCRSAFLAQVPTPDRILIVGEGNGRFLLECCRRFPQAEITCVDASRRMLELAKERLRKERFSRPSVEFVQADAREFDFGFRQYDLIVTHFFLDCFCREELGLVVERLSRAAKEESGWLLADFCLPPSGLARARGRAIHWLMYSFFRCATRISARAVTAPDELLAGQGYELCDRQVREWGLLLTDYWRRVGTPPGNEGGKRLCFPQGPEAKKPRSETAA